MVSELEGRLRSGDVPTSLRGMLLDVPWDLSKLLALDLPVGAVAVDALTWQLDLPWWRDGNQWFVVTPSEVRAHPDRLAEQWRRTGRANLSAPIHLRGTHRGPLILDGLHRLLKAAIEPLDASGEVPSGSLAAADLVVSASRHTPRGR